MSNNKILTLILLCLIALCLAFYYIKGLPSNSGMDISDRQFKLENTDDVHIISIERKDYPPIIFRKNGNAWILNNGRTSKPESTGYIFNILKKLTIRYIPGKAASENILKSIAKSGIKVKLFTKNEKIIKSFYIGADVGDGASTAFLMEGANQPFVMFAQGFEGSIRTIFEFDMNEYETKNIFVENPDLIQEVEIKYPYDKPSSFKITRGSMGFDLFNPYTNSRLPQLNEKLIEPYLDAFKNIIAEYNDANNENRQMITTQPVFCEIILKRKDGTIRNATLYNLENIEFNKHEYSPKELSNDTRFMVATNNGEFFLAQNRVIGKILLSFDKFAKKQH